MPLWGDLPIIGRTGGLDNVTSSEQELVVLVTPVLVHPLDMCKTPPLPGSDVFEPGDVEFYLLGHLEGRRTQDYRASVRTDFCPPEALLRLQRPVHHRPARHDLRLLQIGDCPCPMRTVAAERAMPPPPPEPVPAPAPEARSTSRASQRMKSMHCARKAHPWTVRRGIGVSLSHRGAWRSVALAAMPDRHAGTCNDITPGAIPQPNGTYACQWIHAEAARADQDKFVIYQYEWYGGRHETDPVWAGARGADRPRALPSALSGRDRARLPPASGRVSAYGRLGSAGELQCPDRPDRVIFGRSEAEGLYGQEAPGIARRCSVIPAADSKAPARCSAGRQAQRWAELSTSGGGASTGVGVGVGIF